MTVLCFAYLCLYVLSGVGSVGVHSMLSAANAYQLAGTLVWESYVAMRYTEQGDTYDFTYTSAGNTSVLTQNAWMLSQRVRRQVPVPTQTVRNFRKR